MQIDWWTLILQTINFLVLVWLLWRFLYHPVRHAIEKRQALVRQGLEEAQAQKAEAEAARQRYEQDRAALAAGNKALQQRLQKEMAEERQKIIDTAQKEASGLEEEARARIAREREAALKDIHTEAAGLAAKLAATILEKTEPGALNGTLLERMKQQMTALPEEEVRRLAKSLSAKDARLKVVTARPLSDDEQEPWRKQLGERLPLDDRLDFEVDETLLGGALLRFPHAVLDYSWANEIERAKERMIRDEDAS